MEEIQVEIRRVADQFVEEYKATNKAEVDKRNQKEEGSGDNWYAQNLAFLLPSVWTYAQRTILNQLHAILTLSDSNLVSISYPYSKEDILKEVVALENELDPIDPNYFTEYEQKGGYSIPVMKPKIILEMREERKRLIDSQNEIQID